MNEARDKKGRFANTNVDKKYTRGRAKKRPRKFLGNQEDNDNQEAKKSRSSKKIETPAAEGTSEVKNRIIDINILFPQLENILSCSQCNGRVNFSESTVQGLGFKIEVTCVQCNSLASINSSRKIGIKNHSWEVNRRSVIACRAIGVGHAGLSTFCGIMDCSKPVAQSAFDSINEQLSKVCKTVSKESMNAAIQEEKDATEDGAPGLNISGDGSWRKKGFSSLQGFASIVGHYTGKVLDVSIKNSFCQPCSSRENSMHTAEYEDWYKTHEPNCTANHEGSAGKMEVDGISEIFHRSEEEYNIKYHRYIGDGDSKVFKALCESKPYGDQLIVEKKECIQHVQKRMGTRLRNLVKNYTSQKIKLADNKSIGGKGRLTAKLIDKLSTFYGKAIRSHPDSIEDMRNAIWATFYHMQSTDDQPTHHLCPEGPNSWCGWRKAQAAGNVDKFKHKKSLSHFIMDAVRPIYEDLSKHELLQRCLGGFTQNSNESFNNSVWRLVPKTSFSGLTVFEIGVHMAVCLFNNGRSGLLRILEQFDVAPGHAAADWANSTDTQRILYAERQVQANTKEARTLRLRARQQQEDDSYAAGGH